MATPSTMSKRDELISLYSDMYKDRHNFRPRKDWRLYTDEQLQAMIDDLESMPFAD